MKKSIFLFFAAILCAIGMNAATPEKLYLTPNGNWNQGGARFAAYFFGNGETWVSMTKVDGEDNLYEVTTPAGYPSVIFCRMNPNAAANNWDNKWNQTGDLNVPTNGTNHYTVTENTWDNGGGNWSTYTPPTEPVKHTWTVAGIPASVFEVEWTPGHTANDMVEQADGTYKWEKTGLEFSAAGTVQFKVCQDHDWATAYPGANYELSINAAGIYTITITFDSNTTTVNAIATKTGDVETTEPEEPATPDPMTLYLAPNSNWLEANARFAIYFMGGSANQTWADLTLVEGEENIYQVEVDKSTFTGLIFCRMNPDAAENNWDNRWTQTADLTIPTDGTNCYKINDGSWDAGTWTTYPFEEDEEPVEPTPASMTLYLAPNSNWTTDNARFAAYFYGNGDKWLDMTDADGDGVYEVVTPAGYPNVIFGRMNPGTTENNFNDGVKWTQTGDLTIPTDGTNCYKMNDGSWDAGTWTTYPFEEEGGEGEGTENTHVVYFVNTANWQEVNAYAWNSDNDKNGAWPGVKLTDVVETIGVYDVYKYETTTTYANVIFNGGGQTPDLEWQDGKYYIFKGNDVTHKDEWYDKADVESNLPAPASLTYTVKVPAGTPECYITGENTGGFGTFVKMNPAAEADVFTIDIAWATESQKYKYSASDSWDYEEVNEDGTKVNDRIWQARDEVKKWKTDPTAQVTPVDAYTVTVPAGTKECYIRGGFDNWADFHKMTKVDDTHYTISITGATSIHEYKYASGPDWKYAEVKEDGSDPGNRKWDDVEDIVVKWAAVYDSETATDYSNQPAIIYFRPSTSWKADNARFEVWFFAGKDGAQDKFMTMTDSNNDGVYEVANDKNYEKIIFVRMDSNKAANDWGSMLHQTGDIEIPNVANNLNTCYAFWTNNIDNTAGTWVVPETIGSGNNSAFYTKYSGQTINVIVERTFEKEVLHTLCLPFSLPANWIGTAYQLSGVQSNNAEELVLYVKECSTFEAGKPYIVEPTNDELASKEYLLVDNVTISTTLTPNSVSNQTHVVTLKGILNGSGQTDGAKEYYIGTDGALHKEATNKLALRSIVEITDKSGNPVGVRARVAFNENVETGVEDIIATDAPVKVIVNGQLIIIHDGVKYNVQGQKL